MDEPPQKKFRYETYTQKINAISVDVGKSKGLSWKQDEIAEDASQTTTPLTVALVDLSLIHLQLPYIAFTKNITPLCSTLPLTLHNYSQLHGAFHNFYTSLPSIAGDLPNSGLSGVLSLHHALIQTVLGECLPFLPSTVQDLLKVGAIPAMDPALVEKTYSTLSLILRLVAPTLLKQEAAAQSALKESWSYVRRYLTRGDNKAYVRKCASEAWSGVVRKARGEKGKRLVEVMTEGEGEGLDSVFAESLKGAPHHLHSQAPILFSMLLDHLFFTETPSKPFQASLNNLLISLTHHCSSSALQPLVENLLQRLDTLPVTKTQPVLAFISTLLMTRKGQRFPTAMLRGTMQKLNANVKALQGAQEQWKVAFVGCVVGSLLAGKLAEWLSPGVVLIEGVWNNLDIEDRFGFVNILVETEWKGTEQFLLSHVAKTTITTLPTHPLATLTLLSTLATAGHLSGGLANVQAGRWRGVLVNALVGLLSSWAEKSQTVDENERRALAKMFVLLPHLPNEEAKFAPALGMMLNGIVDNGLSSGREALEIEWQATQWSSTHLLGGLLACLANFVEQGADNVRASVQQTFGKGTKVEDTIKTWTWSREVIKGMAELRSVWSESPSATIATLEPLLKANLNTHDSSLRLSTIDILASLPQPSFALHESKASTSNTAAPIEAETSDLLSLALETESAGMTLKNVRERTTLIARLGRRILSLDLSSDEGARALDDCLVYLVAQLKVNFRPLYPETITTLASVAERYPAQVWDKIWTELVKAAKGDLVGLGVVPAPVWTQAKSTFAEESDDEKEKEFGCPNLTRVQKEVARWIGESSAGEDEEEVKAQITSDRLDVFNYEAQLVGALRAVPAIAEKHTRDIVPLFLQFVKPDGIVADEDEVAAQKLSVRLVQEKVGNYLQLFAKFVNPKAAFRTAELHALWLALLAKGEGKIQSLALDCLFTYKSPLLAPYQEHFRGMLDESRFRDELSKFTLGVNSEVIDPQHRPEVIPVAMRILYGVMTSRRGRTSSHQGPAARKQAALSALAGVAPEELRTLIDLMLEPFESFSSAPASTSTNPTFILSDSEVVAPGKQQVGFLVMLGDVLKHMGPQTVEYWPRLFGTVLELVHRAQVQLGAQSLEEEGDADESRVAIPSRSVRGFGLKRISEFFKQPVNFDFKPYMPVIFSSVVVPRLPTLDKENTQSPSGLLELFAAWAMRPEYAFYLVDYSSDVLPQLYACLVAPKVKAPVIARIFDVVERIFAYADDEPANGDTETKLIKPYVTALLVNLAGLVENTQGANAGRDNLIRRQIAILSQLSRYIEDGSQAARLVTLMSPMLRKPGRQVPEKVKVDILITFRSLLPLVEDFADPSSKFFQRTLNLVSSLFQTMYAKPAREALANLLVKFSDVDDSFLLTTQLVNEINAFSKRRIEEPDFDRRLAAFAKLNDEMYSSLTARDWVPLLHNMLFFIQDPEELSIRSNASYALRRYIDVLAAKPDEEHQNLFVSIIFPGLRGCLRSKLELVRTEVLAVLAAAVTKCEFMPVLAEMRPLLAQGDDEANFFSNIHHIQVHRRARALRRLIDTCAEGSIRESTLATVFLPLVGHFVTGASEVSDHHLVNEAIVAVGRIAGELKWSRYNGLLHHYLKVGKVKAPGQKFLIRTVSAILDNFHFSMESKLPPPVVEEATEVTLGEGDAEEEAEDIQAPVDLQANARIADAVVNRLLPQLNQFIQTKEETDDSIRIPVAFGVVKVAQALPGDSSFTEVSRVLTILSQILRSKDQDTRDLARDTMCKIAKTLGPGWLAHVIKEMRAALQRGPQLQVLAVVTHHILVYVTTEAREEFLNLDDAIADIVHVSAEVVWGQSGRDVATDGFKTKMREVRGAASRGYDSFQLVSRLVSPSKISQVLLPLRDIMQTSQAVKPMQQVDEALRRIALGLNSNPLLGPTELLSLCHTLISNNSQFLKPKRKGPSESQAARDFKVQMKREEAKEEDVYVKNAYKFVGFGLDLFVTAFRRGRFDFADVDILSRLGPMLPVIGNTLYSANAQVLILGLKAAAAMVKCPVPQVEQSMDVIVKQIFNIIKNAGGTVESEVAQTAIKTLAVVIRDCKTTEIKEKQLAYLLGVVNPDLEDHTRQAAIFTLLRSIVARRFVVPEIYDLMERISSIMVTSQSSHAQELCRVVLMQFLLDYPQGKGRLKTQMTFLARNLDYVYESGRISVMELLSAVFTKFSDELIHEYSNLFFVALVITMANDEAEKCREMAGELIKLLFKRMDEDQQSQTLLVLKSWVAKRSDDTVLARAAVSVYSLLLDLDADETEGLIGNAMPDVVNVLRDSASALAEAESADDDSPFADAAQLDHALPYQALTAMSKILSQQPSLNDNLDWTQVTPHLLFPHEWVRLAAARVIGSLFAANPATAPVEVSVGKGKAVVLSSPGLMDIARKSCIILQGAKAADGERLVVSDKLAGQVVKLLWYIGKSWALVGIEHVEEAAEDGDEEITATSASKALPWLMSRLSFIARNLVIQRPSGHSQISNYVRWTPPLLSILRFFAGMVEHLELQTVNQFLVHILSPIYRILDDEGDMNAKDGGDADLDELRQLATEVREFVQNKVGTTEFSRVWEGLRKKVVAKRGERRQKGQVMAVSDPQAWAKRKEQRGDMRKENKKRKVKSFADSKQRERPTKRRA